MKYSISFHKSLVTVLIKRKIRMIEIQLPNWNKDVVEQLDNHFRNNTDGSSLVIEMESNIVDNEDILKMFARIILTLRYI